MSSIIRARSAVTGRRERGEVIRVPLELKVAGPSMLGSGCPDRHPLPLIHSPSAPKMPRPRRCPPARAGSFLGGQPTFARTQKSDEDAPKAGLPKAEPPTRVGLFPLTGAKPSLQS